MEDITLETKISILKSGLRKYEIAKKLNMQPSNFSRLLREGVTKEKKELIEKAISELKEV